VLSDLPSDRTFKPEVPEVKESHTENFYKLEVENNWFTCPALPFRIWFEEPKTTREAKTMIPGSVRDAKAFSAYLDLIQTAEYALPSGNSDDWKKPIEISLWEKVTLGGQYRLGPGGKQTNVLIKLSGKVEGYYVDACWIATDQQYAEFQQRFSRWQNALADYYDVFVR
jgi:hypothetical protein